MPVSQPACGRRASPIQSAAAAGNQNNSVDVPSRQALQKLRLAKRAGGNSGVFWSSRGLTRASGCCSTNNIGMHGEGSRARPILPHPTALSKTLPFSRANASDFPMKSGPRAMNAGICSVVTARSQPSEHSPSLGFLAFHRRSRRRKQALCGAHRMEAQTLVRGRSPRQPKRPALREGAACFSSKLVKFFSNFFGSPPCGGVRARSLGCMSPDLLRPPRFHPFENRV